MMSGATTLQGAWLIQPAGQLEKRDSGRPGGCPGGAVR